MVRHTPPWKTPLLLGNIAHAVDRLVWQLNRLETPAARGDVVAAFREELSHAEWRPMPEGVRLALAKASAARGRVRGELNTLLRALPVDDRPDAIGSCTAAFAIPGTSYGTALLVRADAQPSTLPHRLASDGDEGALLLDVQLGRAFRQAVQGAQREAALLMGGDFHAWTAVRTLSVAGHLPSIPLQVHGTSAGLAFAVAALSSAAGVPINRGDAFSARVRSDGSLAGVSEIPLKVTAALQSGCSRLFVAAANAEEVPARSQLGNRKLEVVVCRTLAEVIEHLGVEPFRRGLDGRLGAGRSRSVVSLPEPIARFPTVATARPRRTRKLLLSVVTLHDPHSSSRGSRQRGVPRGQSGPLLSLVRQQAFDAVVLFGVPALAGRDRGLATTERASQCATHIRATLTSAAVKEHYFASITDPFDEHDVARGMVKVLEAELRRADRGEWEVHVNLAFLTPALHLVLERVLARFPGLAVSRWVARRGVGSGGGFEMEVRRGVLVV